MQGEEYELLDDLTSEVNWCRARNKIGSAFLILILQCRLVNRIGAIRPVSPNDLIVIWSLHESAVCCYQYRMVCLSVCRSRP